MTPPAHGYTAEEWARMEYEEQVRARKAQFEADAADQVAWEAKASAEWKTAMRSSARLPREMRIAAMPGRGARPFRGGLLGLGGFLLLAGGGALGGGFLVDRRTRLELVQRLLLGLRRPGGAVLVRAVVGHGVNGLSGGASL
ncbi:MAG TPA: hypothetical protein VFP53_00020 [Sphingomicrobium sp.]|nr:hypothetical protein [Sphingomicrobium sp.]